MSRFAIIGYPVRHSLSPAIFRAAYPNTEDRYDFIEAATIAEAMEIFRNGGYTGANITAPFKQEILQYCTHIDNTALRASATNLIKECNGELYAYNSDYTGVQSLAEKLIANNIVTKRGIVSGAGGAGRAAALALADLGFEVTILNRTLERAEKFAINHSLSYGDLENISQFLSPNSLLIHTTDHELPNQKELNFSEIVVIEANYKKSNLSDTICKRYISGTEWLISQAVPAFKLLTGFKPDLDAIKKIVK